MPPTGRGALRRSSMRAGSPVAGRSIPTPRRRPPDRVGPARGCARPSTPPRARRCSRSPSPSAPWRNTEANQAPAIRRACGAILLVAIALAGCTAAIRAPIALTYPPVCWKTTTDGMRMTRSASPAPTGLGPGPLREHLDATRDVEIWHEYTNSPHVCGNDPLCIHVPSVKFVGPAAPWIRRLRAVRQSAPGASESHRSGVHSCS